MKEKWRQALHLEAPKGWLNDPNGLCFFGGKYHVYFQYSPDNANGSGKKCWGHYESENLTSWTFTGTVLQPDCADDKDGVYSGCSLVNDGKLNIFYTGNVKENGDHDYIFSGRGANVIKVTSTDGSKMSEKKTLLKNSDYPTFCSCHVRDPKVWYENGKYHMILGARTIDNKGCVLYYISDDTKKWTYEKSLSVENMGYMWECPDTFSIDGKRFLSISPQGLNHENTRFQNVYSSGCFKADNDELTDFEELDYGFDFYAPQTFEAPDGRRILIGWMGIGDIPYENPTTKLGWQHCLTIPRELHVENDGKIGQLPIREINSLRKSGKSFDNSTKFSSALPFDLEAKCCENFKISFRDILDMTYSDGTFKLQFIDEKQSGKRKVRNTEIESCTKIRIIADYSSIEIYLDGGKKVMSTRFYPNEKSIGISTENLYGEIFEMNEMEVNLIGK